MRFLRALSRIRWLAVLLAAPALAGSDERAALVDAFDARYAGLRDFRTRFVQESYVAALERSETSRGRLLYRRPGHLRWEVEEPEPSVLVVDGETLRLYDPEEGVLQIAPVGAGGVSQTALGFLFGESDLRRSFHVELLPARTGEDGERRVGLRLMPRADAGFERLDLWLDVETVRVREVVIHDLLGNRSRIRFEGLEENVGLEETLFTIQVPDDTEVIDLR